MAEKKPKVVNVEAPVNVYQRIANIQQSINTVIKGGYNEHFKYKFAREGDIVAEVKPLLGREKLCITHTLLKEEEVEHGTTSSGAKKYLTKLTLRFRLTCTDNPTEFFEGDGIGSGQDGEDKGIPKAYTMALKYFLSKTFLIETGDDSEETRGGKKGKQSDDAGDKFETAKRMVRESRNASGLIEYSENLKKGSFNAEQKKELARLVSLRIDQLSEGTAK